MAVASDEVGVRFCTAVFTISLICTISCDMSIEVIGAAEAEADVSDGTCCATAAGSR